MADAGDPNDRVAAKTYAAAVLGRSPDDVTGVIRFDGGNRHAVYKVSYIGPGGVGSDLVVRVSFSGAEVDRALAEYEAIVLMRVGGVAGPVLYDFRSESPWFPTPVMCLEFVAGQHRELGSVEADRIRRLGAVVGWLHEQSVDDGVDPLATGQAIGTYADGRLRSILSTLAWARDPLPSPVQERLKSAAETLRRRWPQRRESAPFRSGEPLALLHGDIGPGNVLWGPDPILIDWEYARIGDPADEIAYLFDQNGLDAAQRDKFWDGYEDHMHNRLRAHVADRVTWWEPLTLLGSTLWWLQRYVRRAEAEADDTNDPDAPRELGYYLEQLGRRLDRLNALMRTA